MSTAKIPGFDYVTGKAVAYTAAEWRAKYPAAKYQRYVPGGGIGETWYWNAASVRDGSVAVHSFPRTRRGVLAAEAYAIIPAGKVSS